MNLQESKKIEEAISKLLQKHLPKNSTVILGVSGGADSVFLFHIFKKWQEKNSCKIIVAHINHLLRGKDSDQDLKFVEKLVQNKVEIIFEPLTKDIKKLSIKNKNGLEETGRKIRYQFFEKLTKKYKTKYISTAHHADDNIETILLNLVRGASLQGLSGMQEKESYKTALFLLRPLLNISKKEIIAYLKLHKISFRTDKSNNDKTFTRNNIRHDIIPRLEKINPNFTSTVTKNAKILRETNEFLESKSAAWIKTNFKDLSFDAKKFRKLLPALQKNILSNIHKTLLNNTRNLESKHFNETLKLINNNIGNKQKKFGKLHVEIKNNIVKVHIAK